MMKLLQNQDQGLKKRKTFLTDYAKIFKLYYFIYFG